MKHSQRLHSVTLNTVCLRDEIDKALSELRDFLIWYDPLLSIEFVPACTNIINYFDAHKLSMIILQAKIDQTSIRIYVSDRANSPHVIYQNSMLTKNSIRNGKGELPCSIVEQ